MNQNLGGVTLVSEGSGTNAKYYAQIGADTASKKILGKTTPNMYLWTSSPVDIKVIMPDIYNQLTTADFLVGSTGANGRYSVTDGGSHAGASGSGSCTISYAQSTGVLTFGGFNVRYQSAGNEYGYVSSAGTLFAVYKGTIAGVLK